jgi:hypothetical protein
VFRGEADNPDREASWKRWRPEWRHLLDFTLVFVDVATVPNFYDVDDQLTIYDLV